ncbi:hypothetical protein IJZ97_06210 [bacterium]|nr:hypothetical protein [bacterium]
MDREEQKSILNIINAKLDNTFSPNGKKIFLGLVFVAIAASVALFFVGDKKTVEEPVSQALQENLEVGSPEDILLPDREQQVAEIEIDEVDQEDVKMVSFAVEDFGRANPFLPATDSVAYSHTYGYELMAPPGTIADEEAEAAKVVTTKVSGIMYDPKSPSAILNIEGEDYLVRSGDYINNYKVLSISKDWVTVQLGINVYKAKVGEVIFDSELNHNTVYDLENKFGGAKR